MKVVHVSGKRKTAIARATVQKGSGRVRVNSLSLDVYEPSVAQLLIQEPLLLAGDTAKKFDIDVVVQGGGWRAQADAVRLAVAKGLVAASSSKKLRATFLEYDRNLLVSDARRKEACKPNTSKARAKRQKSYR